MADTVPDYQVFAIRYATRDARRCEHFIHGDPHDAPMPMDYFVWVVVGPNRAVVIDTGFKAEVSARRKREFLRCPVESLRLVGVDPDTVKDVIITHLHYDHVGNFDRFAVAQFHIQEPEIHFAVGRHMRYPVMAHAYEVEDIVGVVRLNYAERVRFYNGPAEVAPGITIHPVGGHTPGMQFVRVHTRRGWVVLASDVSHYYENMERYQPFVTVVNVADMVAAFDVLKAAAPTPAHIVPGHDPLVMRRYPPAAPELEGIAVRLDADPIAT